MTTVTVPQLPQQGVRNLNLSFPDEWDVNTYKMPGHDKAAVTKQDILDAISNPLGTKSLRELAKGKKEVAILFDDYARGSKWSDIADVVVEELTAAGIKDENIRFICTQGCHAPGNRARYPPFLPHDPLRSPHEGSVGAIIDALKAKSQYFLCL